EKRMLQESVDSPFANSRKARAVKTGSNRPLKSLSDSLKGKQGRFRQNLLGKRVDYSARSVIVVGPELKLHECGLPKEMASELYKPFIIRKMLERGIVKTVKSAKKIVDRKDPVVWDILENVLKGHPVLLNRAPTLHRLGIQAFQPKLIEGKAIQLHPLVCTAFNADFDGDQMAVHLPLGNPAILEAQLLMLASHNILNPANGAPIAVPSQDMVLGLYYMTKARKSTPEHPMKGEGLYFYGPEEVIIAHNEGAVNLHSIINARVKVRENGVLLDRIIETTVGRVLFNQVVPEEYGYINQLLTKKALRDIIGGIMKLTGISSTSKFLDDIKDLGFISAFKGGLSFNLGDILVPEEKQILIDQADEQVEEVRGNYSMGFITNNERYNQIIDIWTHTNSKLTKVLIDQTTADNQGFNPVFMMLDSGARGSKEQIRQLSGMRGLMAKPQKSGAKGGEIIENPILSNFKEGLSVLEYFISTHGARKGLADTALKTADAGYLTRRLVDVSQDVIVTEPDCGTLRGLTATALKNNEETVETLYDRILGRTSLHDIYHPTTGEVIIKAGEELYEEISQVIESSPIEAVEIRSVLTCESKNGVCAKCYGRNLATGRMVQKGEAIGVIAAQSIGEPGTQLTLRTFHVGGTASNIASASKINAKYSGVLEIDELRSVNFTNLEGRKYQVVIGRSAEMRIVDKNTRMVLTSQNIPYGANLYFEHGQEVQSGELICEWDPYNAVIISEVSGKIVFNNMIEGATFRTDSDEQTGYYEKVIVESRDKTRNPSVTIVDGNGEVMRNYDMPVGAHIVVSDEKDIIAGSILAKIPRAVGKSGDITGGLPRITELFEARNPSDPAVVSEIDGVVSFGKKIKRGNREVIITSKTGDEKHYLVALTKQILAQENDFVKAGTPLSDGPITPADILAIKGPTAVQEYIVNEVQEVYRMQGVKINDKHFEVIVRQMMRKVTIEDPGDTRFLENEIVNKIDFMEENDNIFGKKVVEDPGDSNLRPGQIITARKLRDDNSLLKRKDKKLVVARDARGATARQQLQGITKASLQTKSFISAASFQETTKVLTDAAVHAKVDGLNGLKENVIVGHLIPAGTGLREFNSTIVGSMEEYDLLMASKRKAEAQ
ncbi:MAG: DNA-directed RNA polymerase subunit beta', partial [Bacteroidales bacterium]